jgi:L-2,4-diaminobutyrate decarboxylase
MELIRQSTQAALASAIAPEQRQELARAVRIAEASRRSTGAPALLAGARAGFAALPLLLAQATDAALGVRRPVGPIPRGVAGDVLRAAAAELGAPELPAEGVGPEAALCRIARALVCQGLDLSHPRAAAHLQPPPLSVAVVADALASASNASLDTYDSGPSAIAIERWLIGVLAGMAGLGPEADGVLTPGGSLSNLLGLLLARDAVALREGVDARRDGIAAWPRPVVFCSELAHFSVHRACAALGLGESSVRTLPTDERRRIVPGQLARVLRELRGAATPLAIVATAGTTDFGSIDPLPELADIARDHGVWLHVDAAYGFGALFSERLAERLVGLSRADSITLDLHKLGWQPAAASVLLVANTAAFSALGREVPYLNPSDDGDAGLDGLLGRSLQTTRRPDAVKVVATLLAYGRRGLGDMVDICHDLARHAEQRIRAEPELELVAPAELTTVVFRYRSRARGESHAGVEDGVNGALRRRLLEAGTALIGRTLVSEPGSEPPARVCLKLTLLNPTATPRDIDELLDSVLRAGREAQRPAEEQIT